MFLWIWITKIKLIFYLYSLIKKKLFLYTQFRIDALKIGIICLFKIKTVLIAIETPIYALNRTAEGSDTLSHVRESRAKI